MLSKYILQTKAYLDLSPEQKQQVVNKPPIQHKNKTYYDHLRKILKFFQNIMKKSSPDSLITKIIDLWTHFFVCLSNEPSENKALNDWLSKTMSYTNSGLTLEHMSAFLTDNLDQLSLNFSYEAFNIFVQMFYKINECRDLIKNCSIELDGGYYNEFNKTVEQFWELKVPSADLDFFSEFFSLYVSTNDFMLEAVLCSFFATLICQNKHSNSLSDELYREEQRKLVALLNKELATSDFSNVKKRVKLLLLAKKCLSEKEFYGFGDFKSIANMIEGAKMVLSIEKANKYHRDLKKLSVAGNVTVLGLKCQVAQEYHIKVDAVQLRRKHDFLVLTDQMNNLTLDQVGVASNEYFVMTEKDTIETTEEPLLDENREFTPKAIAVFGEIFDRFSTNQLMNKKQLAEFISKATDLSFCSENDKRVDDFFEEYDSNGNHFIEFPEFLKFYLNSSRSKKNTVYENMNSLGFGRDLVHKSKVNDNKVAHLASLRAQLALVPNLVDVLFHDITYLKNRAFELMLDQHPDKVDRFDITDSFPNHVPQISFLHFAEWNKLLKQLIFTLCPDVEFVLGFLKDPVRFVHKYSKNNTAVLYCFCFLNSLLFHRPDVDRFLKIYCQVRNLAAEDSNTLTQQILGEFPLHFLANSALDFISTLMQYDFKRKDLLLMTTTLLQRVLLIHRLPRSPETCTTVVKLLIYTKHKKLKQKQPKIQEDKQEQGTATKEKASGPTGPSVKPVPPINSGAAFLNDMLAPLSKRVSQQHLDGSIERFANADNLEKLIKLLTAVLISKTETPRMAKQILKMGLGALLLMILPNGHDQHPTLLHLIVDEDHSRFKSFVLKGLMDNRGGLSRIYFRNFYALLLDHIQDIDLKNEFLKLLIETILKNEGDNVHHLIDLAGNLFSEMNSNKEQHSLDLDFFQLFNEIYQKFSSHESQEVDYVAGPDQNLVAYLSFMDKILEASPDLLKQNAAFKKKLIVDLMKKCLFNISSNQMDFQSIKCKTSASREAALSLLGKVCREDPKAIILCFFNGLGSLTAHFPSLNTHSSSVSGRYLLSLSPLLPFH